MREAVHDVTVKVRMNGALAAVLDATALDRGMTRSELLRQAARKEVLPDGFEAEGDWGK